MTTSAGSREGLGDRLELKVERWLVASRWMLVPMAIGLLGSLLVLLVVFLRKLVALAG